MQSHSLLLAIGALTVLLLVVFRKRLTPLIQPYKKATLLETAIFLVGFLLCFTFIYSNYIFGESLFIFKDIGSDTVQQYVPFYVNLVNDARSGNLSLWDFQYGLGTNLLSCQTWLLDVFNLILIPGALLLGDQAIPGILLAIHALRLLLAGLLFHRVLVFYCNRPLTRILGALIFSFNGFLMLWGTHYWFGNACWLCALMMLLAEYALHSQKPKRVVFLALGAALTMCESVYIGFMILCFIAVYVLMRALFLMDAFSLRKYIATVLPLAFSVLAGVLISGIILVPVAYTLMGDSTRFSNPVNEVNPLSWTAPEGVFFSLTRFFGNNLVYTAVDIPLYLNFYEVAQLGCSIAFFVALVIFLWDAACSPRPIYKKVALLVPAVIWAFYTVHQFLPTFFNVFAQSSYRSSFLVIACSCLMISVVLDKIVFAGKTPKPLLITGAIISLVILGAAYLYSETTCPKREDAILAVLVVLLCIFIMLLNNEKLRPYMCLLASVVIMGSVVIDGYITSNHRSEITKTEYETALSVDGSSATREALAYIESLEDTNSNYRVDKNYSVWCIWEDSLFLGFNGSASYNSVLPSGLQKFYSTYWPESIASISYAYQTFNLTDESEAAVSYFGVKYILSQEELPYSWCKLLAKKQDVYIYENTSAMSIGNLFFNTITESETEELDRQQSSANLFDTLVVSDTCTASLHSEGKVAEPIQINRPTDSTISGTYTCDEACLVGFSIPYNAGWKLQVDGQDVEPLRVNYGFMAFASSEGTHEFTLVFEPAGMMLGVGITLSGIFLLVALCAVLSRQKRKALANANVSL